MIDLPEGLPMYTLDIKQLAISKGDPKLPEQNSVLDHNALQDAMWAKKAYDFLIGYKIDEGEKTPLYFPQLEKPNVQFSTENFKDPMPDKTKILNRQNYE